MKIDNFTSRQIADYILSTYFDHESEHVLDFNFADSLESLGALTDKEAKKLVDLLSIAHDRLYKEAKSFDLVHLTTKTK